MIDPVITKLNWDSDFFRLKVGKLNLNEEQADNIESYLRQSKIQGFQLIYCFLPDSCFLSNHILKNWNGKLVDRKITFSSKSFNVDAAISNVEVIAEDYSPEDLQQLVNLAKISGEYSRFKCDIGFEPGTFERLYSHWMLQSLNGVIADFVFIQRESTEIVGMLTFKENLGKGNIGLIAVAPEFQGLGIGKIMINHLKGLCNQNGLAQIDVATQELNSGACSFYIRNGFKMSSIVNIYHFWNI